MPHCAICFGRRPGHMSCWGRFARVLDTLASVDWSRLHGAYGPAGDVPELIRTMAGPDAEAADKARRLLAGVVYHQGTTYSASPPVVPFLVELLVAEGTHQRAPLACAVARAGEHLGEHLQRPGRRLGHRRPRLYRRRPGRGDHRGRMRRSAVRWNGRCNGMFRS